MKRTRLLLLAAMVLLTMNVSFAQFGGGPGGFGGGPGGGPGGPGGMRGNQRGEQKQNINRELTGEDDDTKKIGTVNGTVLGTSDQKPIEYATISVVDTKTGKTVTGGISNFKGVFNVKQIPEGEYKVAISYIGYETYSLPISISSKNKSVDMGTVYLDEKIDALDEVTVTPEFTSIENRIDKQVVSVGKDMITGGAMARDVFENLPMVDVDFDGNVELQGASVRVLLNNRPTDMTVADLLESIPAEVIDKVELITNPSAKQDPDGVGGIINIITKKGMSMYGYTFNARLGIDTKGKMNGGLNFSTYSGKFLYSLSYNFNYRSEERDNETYRADYRTTTVRPNPYLNYQFGNSESTNMNHSVRASIDYLPNKKNAFSYNLSIGPRNSDSESVSSSYFLPLTVGYDDITKEIAQSIVNDYMDSMDTYFDRYRDNTSERKTFNVENALTFRRDMSDYENLVVDIAHEYNSNKSNSTILNTVAGDNSRVTTNDRSDNETSSHLLTARVDYEKEIRGVSKIELGAKGEFTWRDMPYFYYINEIPDMERSNHFKYDQQLYSLYATYSRYIGNFTVQLGVRGEQTVYHTLGLGIERDGTQIIYSEDKDASMYRDYFSLFPSAGVSYKFGSNNEIAVNYSRRVTRPNVMMLNPSYRFEDPLYVNVGNPYLDPSFTNSIQLRYNKRLSNKGYFGIMGSFRNSTDQVERITTRIDPTDPTKPEGDVLYTTSDNIGSSYNLSAGIMFSYSLFDKVWNINFNTNYVYRETDIPDRENYIKSYNQYSIRLNNNFNIPKTKTRIQFRLNYNSGRAQVQGTSDGMLVASMGVSQNFMKEKLNVSVRVNDLFNSMKMKSNTYGDDYVMFNNDHFSRQTVSFSIAYRLSDIKFKDKRAKGLGNGGQQELAPETSAAQ